MTVWKSRIARRHGDHRRRGGAIVEFAVVLPLLLTILLGIIEYGYVFMVRQSLQHAAREGCRLASLQTSVPPYANVIQRVNDVMAPINVPINAPTVTQNNACEETVEVSVAYSDVSIFGGAGFLGNFMGGDDLKGSCTMRKEGCTLP
ncbi:MAG: pilus assembly protein [Planctomycetes bacterium]|nr:pilus assembly protein [Planctomycetota bacterium]